MGDPPPTSVLLPTVRWTPAIEAVADQLEPDDELLVICDSRADPVAARFDGATDVVESASGTVRLVVAGDPARCSGKANAIAAGMDAARHDRLVWTDDDFERPDDWLAALQADYDRQGPVTEVPFFAGRDPLSLLLEPTYALGGTLAVSGGDIAWAGAVVFERDDLDDEDAFLADLRTTVSDDGLLSEHVDVTPLDRVRTIPIGGTIETSLERHVRFTKIVRYHDPRGFAVSVGLCILATVACLVAPLATFVLSTLLVGGVYATVGVRRPTVLLAYVTFLVQVPLILYGLTRRTFVWGGRRYRWRGKFDVEVIDE